MLIRGGLHDIYDTVLAAPGGDEVYVNEQNYHAIPMGIDWDPAANPALRQQYAPAHDHPVNYPHVGKPKSLLPCIEMNTI